MNMKQGCNLSKFKKSDVGGIQAEQKREYKDASKYKNDVNPELTHLNVINNMISEESWTRIVRQNAENHQKKTGKKLRKDAVVMGSFVETVPASWSRKLCEEYFDMQHKAKVKLLQKHGLDQNCVLSSIRHYDETNPHCTDTFMPIMDGTFNFKKICSRQFYKELGQVCWQTYKEFESTHTLPEVLEEPEWGSGQKHKTEQQYKAEQLEKQLQQFEEEIATKADVLEEYEAAIEECEGLSELEIRLELAQLRKENQRLQNTVENLQRKIDLFVQNVLEALRENGYEAIANYIENVYNRFFQPDRQIEKQRNQTHQTL